MLTVGLEGMLKNSEMLTDITLGSVGGLKNSEMLTDAYRGEWVGGFGEIGCLRNM